MTPRPVTSLDIAPNAPAQQTRRGPIGLSGRALTVDDVVDAAVHHRRVALDSAARVAVNRARAVVERCAASEQPVYGVTTGVGSLIERRVRAADMREFQRNLLRSHACGIGQALSVAETRAVMVLRANSLAKGCSGVRACVIDRICELLNRDVHPRIPSQGSVGASGDLAPLAHLALVVIGEGQVHPSRAAAADTSDPRWVPAARALRLAGLAALPLEAKEALSLMNGTQAMLGIGVLALHAASRLVDSADAVGALSVVALRGSAEPFDA